MNRRGRQDPLTRGGGRGNGLLNSRKQGKNKKKYKTKNRDIHGRAANVVRKITKEYVGIAAANAMNIAPLNHV